MEKILIVSNHKLMCSAFTFLLEKYSTSVTVFIASSNSEVMSLLKREHYALVIIDMNTKDINSLELFLMLSSKSKTTKVLMANVKSEDESIFEMHRLGVLGLLSAQADGDEFVKAIAAMIEDGRYFSPALAEKVFFYGPKSNLLIRHNVLSSREMQVMIMLGKGRSIKEIAGYVYLSEKTISTYKARVYQKMDFQNTAQLVGYLLDHKFL